MVAAVAVVVAVVIVVIVVIMLRALHGGRGVHPVGVRIVSLVHGARVLVALRVQRALVHLTGGVHLRLLRGLLLLLTLKRGLLTLTLLLRGVVRRATFRMRTAGGVILWLRTVRRMILRLRL